jgi:ArsR family transcriptional regulator, arsenate/arsenite/antimonite-responsive transcriptional repressor / arsenate reductase (thioredoxin)
VDATLSRPGSSPPRFLQLAGHPLRWRLLTELALSDRRVRELTDLLGQPQSLVSYHLGLLRAARLVSTRRSSADGRDAYYSVDLARCAELLVACGAALHPGLSLVARDLGERGSWSAASCPRVLFLCTGNSARSQMAQALLERLSQATVEAFSAGSHPKPLHPNAVRVMREQGIDLSGRRAKHMSELADQRFAYVISLCDRVREVCPEFPGHPETVHWSIADPAAEGDSDEQTYPAFQRTAAELEARIRFFIHVIRSAPPGSEVNQGRAR